MGIPGLLKEIGKSERIALSKLAVEHLERTRRPLRIAIDTAIWQFQAQSGQGGKNSALRTLFFRLLKLLALPIHPVFVFDGKNKPLTKRNKSVTRYGSSVFNEMSKKLIQELRFPCHTAPGEAEAECAFLQKGEVVDAVLSEDADALMFGSTLTLRDFSSEGNRGNKAPTHITVLRQADIEKSVGLDPAGMILMALLSGGDYNTDGLPGFGPSLACEIARAGFGRDLLELVEQDDEAGIKEWRERLQYELEVNESGYFKTKHKKLKIPSSFPDRTILSYYIDPRISSPENLPKLRESFGNTWAQDIDIIALREYVADTFDWRYKLGAKRFIRCIAPGLLSRRLWRGTDNAGLLSVDSFKGQRTHFINGGIPELRVEMIPADLVLIDLSAEEDNPDDSIGDAEEPGVCEDTAEIAETVTQNNGEGNIAPTNLSQVRKTPPWDPCVPEKIWIPRTVVQLGVPALVEEWEQSQRDMLADSIGLTTSKRTKPRKATKVADKVMKPGALDFFFTASKATRPNEAEKSPLRQPLRVEKEVNTVHSPSLPTKNLNEKAKTNTLNGRGPVSDERKTSSSAGSKSRLIGVNDGRTLPSPQKRAGKNCHGRSTRVPCKEDANTVSRERSKFISAPPATQSPSYLIAEAGTSLTDSILISSSPLASSTLPELRSIFNRSQVQKHPSPSPTPTGMMPTVTQRNNQRRQKVPKSSTVERNGVGPVATVSIGDFFKPLKPFQRARSSNAVDKSSLRQKQTPDLPKEMSTGLGSRLIPVKLTVVPRDSLPGTWKAVDDDDECTMSTRPRQRLSYVDLAGN